ncbi:MAG: gamma-glutamylcyclotransferase [Candidatus Binatia bacterium]
MPWYFAYGSNMQSATLRGRRGIHFARAVPGRVYGWRLVLDKPPLVPIGESFASIIPDATAEVLGVAYEISEVDLAHLDMSEGVPLGNYQRIELAVQPLTGRTDATLTAFAFMSEHRDPALQPSSRYMSLLIDGALEHGLPAQYVEFLRAIPARPETPAAAQLRPLIDRVMRRR